MQKDSVTMDSNSRPERESDESMATSNQGKSLTSKTQVRMKHSQDNDDDSAYCGSTVSINSSCSQLLDPHGKINFSDVQSLMEDSEFHNTLSIAEELTKCSKELTEYKRNDTINSLKAIQKSIEKSYHKRTISKVSGASAAIVGTSLTVVGFGLSFVTFGASLGLSVVGGVIAAAGGVTMAGADIGEMVKSKSKMKEVERIIKDDRELSTKVQELAEKLSKQVKELSHKYPSFSEEGIFTLVSGIFKAKKSGNFAYNGCKLADISFSVLISIIRTGQLARAGAGAARIAWTGLKTVAGGLSVAGVVFDAVTMPFDIFVLVKGSYDIHKYRSGRGSNSNKANQIEKLIKRLEKHQEELVRVQKIFIVADDNEGQLDDQL